MTEDTCVYCVLMINCLFKLISASRGFPCDSTGFLFRTEHDDSNIAFCTTYIAAFAR